MKRINVSIFSLLCASFLAVTANGADQKTAPPATGAATTTGTGTTTTTAAAPTDPQIAAVVVAANTVDIDAGKMAKAKTKNPEVKKFAEQMITDHTAVRKSAVDLVTKLKVTPEENATSKALKEGGAANLTTLKGLSGKEFDKAYVDQEVAYHQAVLGTIDQTLIPNAKNAELKTLLEKTRPAIAAHLDHAKHIQSTLQ